MFLSAFTGQRDVVANSAGIAAKTPRGEIRVTDPASFTRDFGALAPDTKRGARLAALRFVVRDLAAARAALQAGKIDFAAFAQRLVVAPESAVSATMGATLVFEGAG